MSTTSDRSAERGDRPPGRIAVLGVLVVLGLGSLVAGTLLLLDDDGAEHASATSVPTVPAQPPPPYLVEPAVSIDRAQATAPRHPRRSAAAGVPARLVVPALGVDAPVVPVPAPGGVLLPPSDPRTLGWWSGGAVPGAAHGGALITGHTVHTGGGALDDLETLEPGDRVTVRTPRGRIRYVVSGVSVYRKATLARDAAQLFRQSGPGRLVLITCEDWNGTSYLSNAVVFADPKT